MHEYHDWSSSILIAYAKGARTFERHIDVDADGIKVSPYCSLPEQIDTWFKSFKQAKEMCGAPGTAKRNPPEKEIRYLDSLVRGVFAKKEVPKWFVISHDNFDEFFYLAIPLLKGQLSCREIKNGEVVLAGIETTAAFTINDINLSYARFESLKKIDLRSRLVKLLFVCETCLKLTDPLLFRPIERTNFSINL